MQSVRNPRLPVRIGRVTIGGGAPVAVQTMTKTRTEDVAATVRQIRRLEQLGCEIIRCAVPNQQAAAALSAIRQRITIPLVADIHFDYRLALASIRAGADKIRINPGNIGARWKVKEIIRAAADAGIPIRIGINSGSLPKAVLRSYPRHDARAICAALESALEPFEQLGFRNIVISAKTTDLPSTVAAYQLIARQYRYPLHIGLTEAGLPFEGAIRSSATLAILLADGIGDTIRISLTDDPAVEVRAAYELLSALKLREYGPRLISCPTCGRCQVDLKRIAQQVRKRLDKLAGGRIITVAVMGCTVNGPGEAADADYGIACGRKSGLLFEKSRVIGRYPEQNLVRELIVSITGDR